MRKLGMVGVIGCMVLSSLLSAHAEQSKFSDAYNKVMDALEQLKPGEKFSVVMETENDAYESGAPLEIRFKSEKACYLTLMDISPNGDLTFLAPSKSLPDNKIEAGRVYSTRNDFKMEIHAAALEGDEAVNLFCTVKPFAFFKADVQKEAAYTISSQDETRLSALLKRLHALGKWEWAGSGAAFMIRGRAPIPADAKEPDVLFYRIPMPAETGESGTQGLSKRGMLPGAPSAGTQGKRLFPPAPSTGTTGHADDDAPVSLE